MHIFQKRTKYYLWSEKTTFRVFKKCNEIDFQYYSLIPINLNLINNIWYLQGEINKWINVSPQRFKYINYYNNDNIKLNIQGVNNEIINIAFVNINTLQQYIYKIVFNQILIVSLDCCIVNNTFACQIEN